MTLPTALAVERRITLTKEKYAWRPRYVANPWPLPGSEGFNRELRRMVRDGKGPRLYRDRIDIVRRWLTRQLRKKDYVVIPGLTREIIKAYVPDDAGLILREGQSDYRHDYHVLHVAERQEWHETWQAPVYSVRAFKKPEDMSWEDAAAVASWPIWKDRPLVYVMPKMEPVVHV